MTTQDIQDRMRSCSLFRDFTNEELSEFLDLLDPVEIAAGERVVCQDEQGDSMYLLLAGEARVVHHKDGRSVELAVLQQGDFFGELALVDQGPRSADVIVLRDATLLQITHAALSALAGVFPRAAFKLCITMGRMLVERLRKSNQRYVDSLLFPHGEA